ncbi:MAG: hypothetical protein NTAFB05_21710 [Nitrobacter sp.]|uniref:hypothetical protein n=1 Tax=Nitrobacter sp. TaxID=29420 RepID=UPI00387E01A3
MRLTLINLLSRAGLCALLLLMMPLVFTSKAHADGAFVQQAIGFTGHGTLALAVPLTAAMSTGRPSFWAPRAPSARFAPETTLAASGGNFASTLQIGNYNSVFQAQAGSGNISNVGIIKGDYNKVGVLQAGHSLRSNLLLVNTTGLSVGVIQPNRSAPVNMLIARLPNGGLLIKR